MNKDGFQCEKGFDYVKDLKFHVDQTGEGLKKDDKDDVWKDDKNNCMDESIHLYL